MNARDYEGWLFDIYTLGPKMVLWFLTVDGERLRAESDWLPVIYLQGPGEAVRACTKELVKKYECEVIGWRRRMDIWSHRNVPVMALRLLRPDGWKQRLNALSQPHPRVTWHDAGIAAEQHWLYAHDISPLLRCRFTIDEGKLQSILREEDPWLIDYEKPSLETVTLAATGTLPSHKGGRLRLTSVTITHKNSSTTWDTEEDILLGLQSALDRIDPDVIFSSGGDAFGIPLLFETARRAGIPLRLDREKNPPPRSIKTEGRSYFSYGSILYSDPDSPLYGRWHMDTSNSFMISHSSMDGFLQSVRICKMAPQRLARRSIGTGLTSMQIAIALENKVLVPWKKIQAEAWKSAYSLTQSDRGGLVYAPMMGMYERVVELDFMSMFATIMVHHVSPEMIGCSCCNNTDVPGLGYRICKKYKAIISEALRGIVDLRAELKKFQGSPKCLNDEALTADVKQRRDALKWFLVCSFGYLGYRNAIFGRTEAHEAVCAFAREYLVAAREAADRRGWTMLHANVDSFWLVKKGFQESEITELIKEIEEKTKLPILLEGIYNWLAFLPSRQVENRPVPTRFFGSFQNGGMKYRGIECRRHDIPRFFSEMQQRWLEELSAAKSAAEYAALIESQILPEIQKTEEALWRYEVPLNKLIFRTTLSQSPEEYKGNGPQALAAKQGLKAGLNMHAGQSIEYIITGARDADRDRRVSLACFIDHQTSYDRVEYVRCLRRTANTILWPAKIQLEEKRIERGKMRAEAGRRKARKAVQPEVSETFFGEVCA